MKKLFALVAFLLCFTVSSAFAQLLSYTTKPYTIEGTDYLTTALLTEVETMFVQSYSNFDAINTEGTAARGVYGTLALRLSAMDASIAAAGDGDAYFKSGTDAERLADGDLIDMGIWSTTDTDKMWVYETGATTWWQLLLADSSGNLDIPGTLDVTGFGTFDASLAVTGTATITSYVKPDYILLDVNGSGPATSASQGALYVKDVDSVSELFWRPESSGTETQLTSAGMLSLEIFREKSAAPSTAANIGALYAKEDADGSTALFWRGESDDTEVQITRNGGYLGPAPPMLIPLRDWQTLDAEYKVEIQDASNTDGHGADLAYHYVFTEAVTSFAAMYTTKMIMFSGYDLRVILPYRMSTSVSGNVYWLLSYIVVSSGDTVGELANWAAWSAIDTTTSYVNTPSATANVLNIINTNSFKIPASAYSAGDILYICLIRDPDHASDTHTGNAEVVDDISLMPVVP